MSKNTMCFITNTAFGKSNRDDEQTISDLEVLTKKCEEENCYNIVICGGLYNMEKDKDKVMNTFNFISKNLPRNFGINYHILSSYQEKYVLVKHGINLNAMLVGRRNDVYHLGFDKKNFKGTLLYSKVSKEGFNNGEAKRVGDRLVDPSVRLSIITKDYDGELVVIGGNSKLEEFVYNDQLILSLPSFSSESKEGLDSGYVLVDKTGEEIKIDEHVKCLKKTLDC